MENDPIAEYIEHPEPLEPCPHCRADISPARDTCPSCGGFLTVEAAERAIARGMRFIEKFGGYGPLKLKYSGPVSPMASDDEFRAAFHAPPPPSDPDVVKVRAHWVTALQTRAARCPACGHMNPKPLPGADMGDYCEHYAGWLPRDAWMLFRVAGNGGRNHGER